MAVPLTFALKAVLKCCMLACVLLCPYTNLWPVYAASSSTVDSVHCSVVLVSQLQYIAMQFSEIQNIAMQLSEVQYIAMQFSVLQYIAMQFSELQYIAMQFSAVQYSSPFVGWVWKMKLYQNLECLPKNLPSAIKEFEFLIREEKKKKNYYTFKRKIFNMPQNQQLLT